MTYFIIFKNIIAFILAAIIGIGYAFLQGKRSQKNNQTRETLKDVLATNKRKEARSKIPYSDKLKWLRLYDKS